MTRHGGDEGFTLIEVLVAMSLFAVLSIGFYQVMFSGIRGAETGESVARISEEARLAFNRMVRDTREATAFACTGPSDGGCITESSFQIEVDFNGDGEIHNPPELRSNGTPETDYERVTLAYDDTTDMITLNGEALIDGVRQVGTTPVFTYSSNLLQYDADADGTTTWEEIDGSSDPGIGDGDDAIDESELQFLTSVSFAFEVQEEDRASEFFAEAQIRNRR